jgi:hypothetical protein
MRRVKFLGERQQRLTGGRLGVDVEVFQLLDGQFVKGGGLGGLAPWGKQAGRRSLRSGRFAGS